MSLKFLRSFVTNSDASAAVEAAIFAPIFIALTFGITDAGMGMFVKMTVNAAAQAGAFSAFAKIESGGPDCLSAGVPTLTSACQTDIKIAMNDAVGGSSFCTSSTCTQAIGNCPNDINTSHYCVTVTATYPYTPILPNALYSLTKNTQAYSSTATIRVQ